MESSTLVSAIVALVTIVLVGAWVGGYLDRYRKIAQDVALDAMGENRASYGLKGALKGQKLSDDKDFNNLQEDAADTAGGLLGKGGLGESVGSGLSQGLRPVT